MKQSVKADTLEPPELAFHSLHFTDLNHFKIPVPRLKELPHSESAARSNSTEAFDDG